MSEPAYICPVCGQPLDRREKSYMCENHHTFDIARSGYVNLCRKQKPSGDNKAMVKARTEFLEKGYYEPLRQKVCKTAGHASVLADIGCGQGYYTKELPADTRYGFDLAKEALVHAAKQDKKTHYCLASIYDIPLADKSVDVITSIFTPLPVREICRLLKPEGELVQVLPGPDHLKELKALLYENVYLNPEEIPETDGLTIISVDRLRWKQHVNDVWDLFEMTPYRYRSPAQGIQRVRKTPSLDITFDFYIVRRKRKEIVQNDAAKPEI